MGSPVKIDTLARNLIRLSGFKPDVDIKIKYTGLRPGEKLYEEKLMAEEGLKTTPNKLIHIGCPIPFDTNEFLSSLEGLMLAAYNNRRDIKERVAEIVTTYHPQNPEITVVKDGKYRALTQEEEVTELPSTEPDKTVGQETDSNINVLIMEKPAGVRLEEMAALFFDEPDAAAERETEAITAEPAAAEPAGELPTER